MDRRGAREGGLGVWRLCTWQKVQFVKLTKGISKSKNPSQEIFKLSVLLQPKSLPFPHFQELFLSTQKPCHGWLSWQKSGEIAEFTFQLVWWGTRHMSRVVRKSIKGGN